MTTPDSQQYFTRPRNYGRTSEHAKCFASVSKLEYEEGKNAFQALCAEGREEEKLEAIACFAGFLAKNRTSPEHLGDLFHALCDKYFYALEDTQKVSDALCALIGDMFEAARPMQNAGLAEITKRLLGHLMDMATEDMPAEHPVARSERLVRRLLEYDPRLLTATAVSRKLLIQKHLLPASAL